MHSSHGFLFNEPLRVRVRLKLVRVHCPQACVEVLLLSAERELGRWRVLEEAAERCASSSARSGAARARARRRSHRSE